MSAALHAIALQVANVKRITALHVDLDPNFQVISGRNGQGKTSAIDALAYAIGGAKMQKACTEVVRRGEKRATVKVTLGRGDGTRVLDVTVEWKASGGRTLTVTDAVTGAAYPKPQGVLDDLVGALSFDPLAFMGGKAADQRAQLLELVELPFDPAEMESQRAAAYEARTLANREVKRLEGVLSGLAIPAADTPDEEVSTASLLGEHQAATQAHDRARTMVARADAIEARLEELKAEALALDAERKSIAAALADAQPLPDLDAITARMATVDETNQAVRAKKAREATAAELAESQAQARQLTDKIEQLDSVKLSGLAAAAMPIEGLGFDSDGVTYNGLPLSQASGAEQLRVSLAIAIAANPTLRLMLIRDGSLLDPEGLALVARMAAENECQVIVERVAGSGGPAGIVIEDGEVQESAPSADDLPGMWEPADFEGGVDEVRGPGEEVIEPTPAAVALVQAGDTNTADLPLAAVVDSDSADPPPDLGWLFDGDGPEAA